MTLRSAGQVKQLEGGADRARAAVTAVRANCAEVAALLNAQFDEVGGRLVCAHV